MNSTVKRRVTGVVAGLVVAASAVSLSACSSSAGSTASGTSTVRMASEPWIGYGPWWVADKKGFFGDEGLTTKITSFDTDADLNAAFASGKVDVANVATHTALHMAASGIKMKIIMIDDVSMTADSIIAPDSITSVSQLKGKSVAYEQGTTSDLLLNYALQSKGMTVDDVKPVPMDADAAGSALLAGKVNVAVTYEPYITTALTQKKGYHRLFTAGEKPGLISDVLIVRDDYASSHAKQLKKLVASWGKAVDYYNSNTSDARAIIAKAVGSDPKDLDTAFDGVKLYSLDQEKSDFSESFAKETVPLVMKSAISAKILDGKVETDGLFDDEYLK